MRYVLIMAGGSGKRLWPLSRQGMPKQLLKVVGGKSLLRIAYERLDRVVPPQQVLICTGADYAHLVAAELPEVDPANILGEPEGRDSLNVGRIDLRQLRGHQMRVIRARADQHLLRWDDAIQSLVSDPQQALTADHLQQLLGHALAGQRPQTLARASCHDQHVAHAAQRNGGPAAMAAVGRPYDRRSW